MEFQHRPVPGADGSRSEPARWRARSLNTNRQMQKARFDIRTGLAQSAQSDRLPSNSRDVQLFLVGDLLHLVQRPRLDLPDALLRDAEFRANLLQGQRLGPLLQAVAMHDDRP